MLLSCIEAEIRAYKIYKPPSWFSKFRFYVTDITIEVINPENMGVVVGIVFLASPEAEIHLKWE